ncbi:MAG TPA: amino acid adenylation domain-containing protein [Thermoanaerobaculia bacterium]|nr:amino acid adenylation domain-containing protein [Thermoanaerobaculia bacterium]
MDSSPSLPSPGLGLRSTYPRNATLVELFAAQVERAPEAPAVVFGNDSLTYAELDRRANRLARHLIGLGVGPGSLVGLCLERSADLIVSFLGILKAGAAYLPLDPSSPAERLRWMLWMLEDTGVRVAIDGGALAGSEPPGLELVRLAEIPLKSAAPLPLVGSASDLAYVMYTSGTTGLPKGVAIPHRGIVRLVVGTDYFGVRPGDRVLQASTPAFDASTMEIWGALLNGACLVVLPREVCLSPFGLKAALRREGITIVVLTSALVHQVAREAPDAFDGVRDVIFGGETADPHLLRRVLAHGGPGRLINVYGPTESTVIVTWHQVREVPPGAASVPIGRPISNTDVWVLDPEMRPLPPGEPGEILLGGDGLARGYWARPEVTAEMFVPDPFAGPETAGSRLYRTGDLGVWREDGALDFLGRVDRQIKIRGFRVEPGEIEAALAAHPAVRQAHVAVRPHPAGIAGESRLVAYVVIADAVTREELHTFLVDRLPAPLVPSAVVLLETFPLNLNGKVDHALLPNPDRESSGLREHVEPRTELEARLAAIWSELLGVEKPGVLDDFFALGGHSITAGQLVSRLRSDLGVELPLRDVYDHPTLARLAVRLETAAETCLPPISRAPRDRPLPLSYPQRRLWFLDRLEPGLPVYNVPLFYRISGPLDVPALESSLTELVRRHEVLRTVFEVMDGEPVQVVLPAAEITLPMIDVRAEEAERRLREEARRPFDLQRGPLVRPLLLRVGPEDYYLLLGLHHITCDGGSAGALARDMTALYGRSPLPELPLQYGDFAEWQVRSLRGAVLESLLGHWRERLAGVGDLPRLATDRPRPTVQSYRGDHLVFELPAEALEALARSRGTSLFTVLLAAFFVFLRHHTGGDDVAVGTPATSRGRAELEPLIGLFLNTLVLRADLGGDPIFPDLLDRVRNEVAAAIAHQDLPFEKLVEELQPERDLGRNPLFDVLFSYREGEGEQLRLPGLELEQLDLGTNTAKLDLTLSISRASGRLRVRLEYATDLFERATAERLAARIATLFASVAEGPARRLSDLPSIPESERRQMIVDWNRTALEVPDATIHGQIAAQAARTPGAVAVVWRGESWTFAELQARAGRLAAHLRRLGVGPEVPVGIHLERSADMLAAVLAVLQAGGAYLPLDPAYPEERRAFMLADSGAHVVITTRALLDDLSGPPLPLAGEGRGGGSAYLLYTSGSTGRPKGVQVSHRNVVSFFAGMDRVLGIEPGIWLAVTSLSFDISVLELLWTLSRGFRVVIADPERPLSAQLAGVTHLQCTPSLAQTLAADPAARETMRPLRRLILGGEPLSMPLANDLASLIQGELWNLYGPTETTVWSAAWRVRPGPVSIGRPIANTRIYLLDRDGRPAPLGVPAELAIGGAGVARGYLGRPDLTAERFVPDPFESGARLYKTGDLARWRPSGELEFLGRLDHQVKLRGHRIELGEVEAVLCAHPSVRQAAVIASDHRLLAFVALDPGAFPDLRSFLEARLPGYMVPCEVVSLPALPLTPNGKLDRRALAAMEVAPEPAVYLPPSTPLEEEMAALWAEILSVERVGLQDTFWKLGGHSLLATRLLNRLQYDLGVELPLRALFQSPELGAFTRIVGQAVLSCCEGDLSEVEGLSDTEVRALLQQEAGSIL